MLGSSKLVVYTYLHIDKILELCHLNVSMCHKTGLPLSRVCSHWFGLLCSNQVIGRPLFLLLLLVLYLGGSLLVCRHHDDGIVVCYLHFQNPVNLRKVHV